MRRNLFLLFNLWLNLAVLKGQGQLASIAPEAQIAFVAKEVSSGSLLRNHNAELLMIPASTQKILTTATALGILGKDFRYNTRVFIRGKVHEEILQGDLIIQGGGDPTLGSDHFLQNAPEKVLKAIQEQLMQRGIRQLNGKIIIDGSTYPASNYPSGRLWDDIGNYYAAIPRGFSWRDNTFEIDLWSPTIIGATCKVQAMRPHINNLEFRCYVLAAPNNKDSAYIYGYPGLPVWEIRGSIPMGRTAFTIQGAMPDPAFQFATELKALLSSSSNTIEIITTDQPQELPAKPEAHLLTIESPSLQEIIRVVNQKSHNLMADHLFLSLGAAHSDNLWLTSAGLVAGYWLNKGVAGPIRLVDGSGLSVKNLVSARYMVDLLGVVSQQEYSSIFESSLAVGGKSGTLSRMWQQPDWLGRVVAKSGSMEGVVCYAGYVYTRTNRKIAFSIMVNNFVCPASKIRKEIETEIGNLIEGI
jgi:serine-type D-Ala-D-Ala carboxypeptidase/endopeptidase (penicillin-binding protein 4)